MSYSHFIVKKAVIKTLQRLHCKPQRTAIFNLSLLSHTQKTVVTLTQSHTPTTTVSQRTHRPTDKHLCQQTHTQLLAEDAWRSFRQPGSLSVCLPCPSFLSACSSVTCVMCLFTGFVVTEIMLVRRKEERFDD